MPIVLTGYTNKMNSVLQVVSLFVGIFTVYCQYGGGSNGGGNNGSGNGGGGALPNYRVLSIATPSSNFLQVNPPGSATPYSGFIWDFLNALKDSGNFTFTLSIEADGIYGVQDANGNWNGMVGQLIANNTDIIAADLTENSQREVAMDFTVPFAYYHLVTVTQTGASLTGLKYAVQKDTADYTYLSSSVDPTAQAIWASIQANLPTSLVSTDTDGLALVQQGGWAYVAEDVTIGNALKNSNGKLNITGPILETAYFGLGVQLGSKLGRPLSIHIMKITESGQLQELLNKYGLFSA